MNASVHFRSGRMIEPHLTLDHLGEADINDALALSTAQGWNQTAVDWRRVLRLGPTDCFAARKGHHVVGTVTTTKYGRELAWIGMMIVHPAFRRQGVGTALMRLALDHLQRSDVASVKLDATPEGLPLYASLGFMPEVEIERWQGVANPGARPTPPRPADGSLGPLLALDSPAYGADRSRLLQRLVADGSGAPHVIRSGSGKPEGYALARPGRRAVYIGPVVGTSREVCGRLLDGMLGRFQGEDVCLDVHRGGLLGPADLTARGMSKRRSLTRMYLGSSSGAARARWLCASAGPELG